MDVRVSGGTGAGWRNPFQGHALPWQCKCLIQVVDVTAEAPTPDGFKTYKAGSVEFVRKTNPGHLANCPDCWERRP